MKTTEQSGERLATHRNEAFRKAITVRSAPITARLEQRRRLVAFCELFSDASRKPDAIYDLQRSEPRCGLPDEKQRSLIHQGIREGYITRDRLIRYRLSQILDDLEQFGIQGEPADALSTSTS